MTGRPTTDGPTERGATTERAGVLILGAGLTGLSAAYHLLEAGADDVLLLEAEDVAGGLLRTNRADGVTIDHLPHVFFTGDEAARRVFRDVVGDFTEHPSRLGVRWGRGWVDFPFQNHVHQLPLEERRAILASLLARRNGTHPVENLEQYAIDTLGAAIVDLFFRPYNEKLWQTPIREMGYRWIASKIRLPDARELADSILGTPRERDDAVAPHAKFWYPRAGGIQALSDGLVRRVGAARVRLGTRALRIDSDARVVETDRGPFAYDRLVSTLPIDVSMALAGLEGGAGPLGRLRATKIVCTQIVARRLNLPPYHWMYVPDPATPYYRLTRVDLFNPDAAPGRAVLLAECALERDAPHVPGEHADRVVRALADEGICAPEDVERRWEFAHAPAYVVPHRTHEEDADALVALLADAGVVAAGRFGEWRFFNMDHSIAAGARAAEKVLQP